MSIDKTTKREKDKTIKRLKRRISESANLQISDELVLNKAYHLQPTAYNLTLTAHSLKPSNEH